MKQTVVYIHGKGGSIQEADHYRSILEGYDVIGFDYHSDNPWDAEMAICGSGKMISSIAV